jgi:uncharacterized protein (TIGR00255 family)
MTGYGEAHRQADEVAVAIEVRTINNRYFKLSLRASEGYGPLETQIENVVRSQIKRGTVQVNLRVDHKHSANDYRINHDVLEGYRVQLAEIGDPLQGGKGVSVEALLMLPGVVEEHRTDPAEGERDWPLIRATLEEAMTHLATMRTTEGATMAGDLIANNRVIATELQKIAHRAPQVVDGYRARLQERLKTVLNDHQIVVNPADLIREISIYAERSDISEEIVRLNSHLEQFAAIMEQDDAAGRKLEFLAQEMLRETNTIGSKATDVEIARHVIEIKAAIERVKEMIQNVE